MRTKRRLKRVCHGDRLSNLPDEILTQILSVLPTKDAAITTVVSKKFEPAFSVLTDLELDDSLIPYCLRKPTLLGRRCSRNFKEFVDYVLLACQSKQIGRFKLRFSHFCGYKKPYLIHQSAHIEGRYFPLLEPQRLDAWISFPLARGVRELDLCIKVNKTRKSREYCMLPVSIFACETLEMLKLDSNLHLPDVNVKAFPIRLPHLKLLHLRSLVIEENVSVTELVDSCPVLEDLVIDCWWDWTKRVLLFSRSLLKLDLSLNRFYQGPDSVIFMFSTPTLQILKLSDSSPKGYLIPNMSALVQAEIIITSESICYINLARILKSCSAVSRLSLLSSCALSFREIVYGLPVFPNVIRLELGRSAMSWDSAIMNILEHFPSLETLVFPQGLREHHNVLEHNPKLEFWRLTNPQAIPSCCKSRLKNIVIKEMFGEKLELSMIRFLLKKALVLKSLVISLSEETAESQVDQFSLQSALEKMPMSSASCSIRVE